MTADYTVTPSGALGVGEAELVRVNCRSLRIRSRVPMPADVPTTRERATTEEHCQLSAYRSRFGIPDSLGTVVYADSLDTVLRRRGGPRLAYPRAMRDAGYSGWAVVAAIISRGGEPTNVRVMASSHRLFEPPVVEWLEGSVYSRPILGGRAVAAFWCQLITFSVTR